jgi:hypothetical protein
MSTASLLFIGLALALAGAAATLGAHLFLRWLTNRRRE